MAVIPTTINLDQFETNNIFKLESRAAGTYQSKMAIRGNSLLSSVFVQSIDPGATLQVNYYDTTTGTDALSERFDLVGHDLITDADVGKTFRVTVSRIHNKPQIEAIVTGGNVVFGVYITVVSSFVTDLDNALVRDGDIFEPLINKGIPFVCLNRTTNTLHFAECTDNGLKVDGTFTAVEEGNPFFASGSETSIPGAVINVVSFTVPAGVTRKIKRLNITTSASGDFSLLVGGSEIDGGVFYEARKNIELKLDPSYPISAGTLVELKFTAEAEPTFGCPVRGFISALDVT